MMRRPVILAALAVFGAPASPQTPAADRLPGAARCILLRDAIETAASRDPRIGQARANSDRNQAELKIARGGSLPQISAFNRVGIGDGVQADNEYDNRAGLRLSQRVFDFGRTDLARRGALERLTGSRETIEDARLAVADEVARHHLAISRAEDRAAAAALIGDYYRRDVAQAEEQLAGGLLKRSEAAGIRAEAARAGAAEAEERLVANQERTALATLVEAPVACVDAASADAFLRTDQPNSLQTALQRALDRSPALRAGEAAARAAELARREERRAHLPDFSVAGTVAYDYGLSGGRSRQVNRFGFDVSTPLFQGGQLSGRTDARSADARAAEFSLAAQRRSVMEMVTIAWTRTQRLDEVLRLQQEAVRAASEQAAALEQEYASQLVTLADLIEVRRIEYEARLNEIDTRYQLSVERTTLLRLTARLTGL